MSDIHSTSIGFIAPIGDFGRHNSQITGSVNHLWKDFYAQALVEQSGTDEFSPLDIEPVERDENVEPRGGSDLLSSIVTQRHCDVISDPRLVTGHSRDVYECRRQLDRVSPQVQGHNSNL